MMVVEPAETGVANPLEPVVLLMVATDPAEELQATCDVRSWVELSENVPLAVNCWEVPIAIFGFSGSNDIDCSMADVTVRVVVPEILPNVAEMAVEPVPTDVARPLEPAALLIDATDPADELQVT